MEKVALVKKLNIGIGILHKPINLGWGKALLSEIENLFFANCAVAERADETSCISVRASVAAGFCMSCFIEQKFRSFAYLQRQGRQAVS